MIHDVQQRDKKDREERERSQTSAMESQHEKPLSSTQSEVYTISGRTTPQREDTQEQRQSPVMNRHYDNSARTSSPDQTSDSHSPKPSNQSQQASHKDPAHPFAPEVKAEPASRWKFIATPSVVPARPSDTPVSWAGWKPQTDVAGVQHWRLDK